MLAHSGMKAQGGCSHLNTAHRRCEHHFHPMVVIDESSVRSAAPVAGVLLARPHVHIVANCRRQPHQVDNQSEFGTSMHLYMEGPRE
jgi:hypothetical protein